MIIVTGATGMIGRALLPALSATSRRVSAVTRNSRSSLPSGTQRVVADLTDPKSLRGMMGGADTLVLVTSGMDQFEQESNALREASEAEVRRVIKVSAMSVRREASDRITQAHRAIEAELRASDFEWAVVRCNAFMSNALNWRWTISQSGAVYVPFAQKPVSAVAPEDIARLIAALLEGSPPGAVLEATGPEAITPAEQVAILADQLARQISVIDVPPNAMREQLVAEGVEVEMAEALISMMAEALDPDTARVSDDIEKYTGRAATTFRDWVRANVTAF